MSEAGLDIAACDREPIHIPGSIQPYGVLLVVSGDGPTVTHAAGDVERILGRAHWHGAHLAELIGEAIAGAAVQLLESGLPGGFVGQIANRSGAPLDVIAHRSGGKLLVELEPASPNPLPSASLLAKLETAVAGLERSPRLQPLCQRAAAEFRALTGYDRVMVYRFLDDGSGAVIAEERRPDLHSFLHHHFPASDIPRQARALYLRNLVRVIPDADYRPAPVQPAWTDGEPLDMSDCVLRSVSPIHLQYLHNMGVRASASISIVKDGALWGLVACHNETPLPIPYDMRAACRALAGALARQIKAREEAEGYRERIRLRGFEDDLVGLLSREGSVNTAVAHHLEDVRKSLGGDGVALLQGGDLVMSGSCPEEADVRALAHWAAARSAEPVFATDRLGEDYPPARSFEAVSSGLLAMTLSAEEPWVALWFRAEEMQVIEWAGNPHKAVDAPAGQPLTPRASFEAWREVIRGTARRWTIPEVEAAGRLRAALLEVRRNRQLQELNRRLLETLREKDALIQQKQFLIGEVSHRVQNSLQLVSSFLALQARASNDPGLHTAINEARRRLNAVALVHRRLYRSDQIEVVDASRYIEELCADMLASMDHGWAGALSLDLSPVMLPTDRAVTAGLVLTELITNANKYAYGGAPGPLEISLVEDRAQFRLSVADHGGGKASPRQGFGSRMMEALVSQLNGDIEYRDNKPGLRAVLTAPIEVGPGTGRQQTAS
jgi:light-regulated signal transduction histidine kinase (bacteriophytochrome)